MSFKARLGGKYSNALLLQFFQTSNEYDQQYFVGKAVAENKMDVDVASVTLKTPLQTRLDDK